MRSFDAWMSVSATLSSESAGDHAAWEVDPLRLRHMTQYSCFGEGVQLQGSVPSGWLGREGGSWL